MALYQILLWQDLPSQIKAWDDFDEVKIELPQRFAVQIDASAQVQKLTSADNFLAQWKWSDEQERNGSAQEVADAIKAELEAKFP
jgi:hypothetical protein